MDKRDFYYDLPEELIAQTPREDREHSRLMVLDQKTGEIQHRVFTDILDYLNPGDCLVLNNTRVIPARLYGQRKNSGGKIEFLLLKKLENNRWETLVKPGRKARVGDTVVFGEGQLEAEILEIGDEGSRIVEFKYEGIFEELLEALGEMPLPHYIHEKLDDKERYQTVYSKVNGSAAAPTAGLHFTSDLLKEIEAKGIKIAYVTLHVGLGTFRPVKVDNIFEHKMHSEYYHMTQETADIINEAKANGGKVIAVGTTSTRTLESIADENGQVKEQGGWTDIFIYPGYQFKVVDRLITNFHLPESTLIMLVSALASREHVLSAYEEAVREQYKFFSLGDAMFLK